MQDVLISKVKKLLIKKYLWVTGRGIFKWFINRQERIVMKEVLLPKIYTIIIILNIKIV